MIGTTLDGKYRIDRLVGAGAMGAVYEGEHLGTGRRVAIKVISAGDISNDPRLVARFQREAKAAGSIDTQHITQVLDTGADDSGSPYLVLELLKGEDLSSAIKRVGPLPPDLALRVVFQTCLALQKAHEAHVVHRDIKPANLFLARRDAGEVIVKLLDFGVAKVKAEHASDAETAALTKTGSMLGSPLYMSPEQAKGLKTIDHRADLWSLGIVLYQALTGRTPYDHCDALGGLIIAICHEDVTPVQDFAPWVAPEVAAIVHHALQRDPNERYQTASEVIAALKPLLPHGWALNEDMFVSLTDATKAVVAPRMSATAPPAPMPSAPSPPTPSAPPPPMPPSAPAPAAVDVASAGPTVGSTTAALVQSPQPQPAAPAPKASIAPVLLGVALAGALGGGLWLANGGTKPPPVRTLPKVIASTATVTAATAQPKRVQVVILPADAAVELDGAKSNAPNGLLDVTGASGSVHRVRVSKGTLEVSTDVTITDAGASPSKIDLSAAAPAPSGNKR